MIKKPGVWNLSLVDGGEGSGWGMLGPREERRCDQGDRALTRARTDAARPKEKGTAHQRLTVRVHARVCVYACAGYLG